MYAVVAVVIGSHFADKEIAMLGHIKDVIGDKAIVYNESYNVDEERQLIAFEPNDLAAIIKDVILTCADMCEDDKSRQAVLSLTT